jgi:hypothetical protein
MANPIQGMVGCISTHSKMVTYIVLIDPDKRLGALKPISVHDDDNNLNWVPEKFWVTGKGARMVLRIRAIDKTQPVSFEQPGNTPDGGSVSVTLQDPGGGNGPVVTPIPAVYTGDDGSG